MSAFNDFFPLSVHLCSLRQEERGAGFDGRRAESRKGIREAKDREKEEQVIEGGRGGAQEYGLLSHVDLSPVPFSLPSKSRSAN